MMIQVSTDHNLEGSEELTMRLESEALSKFERYEDRLSRVELHFSDEDGERSGSGSDKRCLLEARPEGMQPVVVTGSGDTVERAFHDATQKMLRMLDSMFGRLDAREPRATIRHAE